MSPKARARFSGTLVLASASPRRRALLTEFGYRFVIQPVNTREVTPAHLTVAEMTLLNAKAKAEAAAVSQREKIVLGADTLVALDGAALGKPRDPADARAMLARLSGRTHEVFSGVWLVHLSAGQARGFIEVSRVRFRELSAAEIRAYMRRIHVLDKAGAYAAQEDPLRVIAEIRGSRTNVIGLPMETLARALQAFG